MKILAKIKKLIICIKNEFLHKKEGFGSLFLFFINKYLINLLILSKESAIIILVYAYSRAYLYIYACKTLIFQ